jgi:MFS family permease
MTLGTVILASGQLTLGLAPNGQTAAVGIVVGLLGVTIFTVVGRTLRQALTPDRLLGRVVTSFRLIGVGAVPAGAVFGGWIARVAGLRAPYLVGSVIIALAAVIVYRVSTPERVEG